MVEQRAASCMVVVLAVGLTAALAAPGAVASGSESYRYVATAVQSGGVALGVVGPLNSFSFDERPTIDVVDDLTVDPPVELCAHGSGESYCTGPTCGNVVIIGDPFAPQHVDVTVYAASTGADLVLCFGTTGTVTATY